MPLPTELYAFALTLALAALVAFVVSRLTVARWISRVLYETPQTAAQRASEQTAIACAVCGTPVADVEAGIEHVDEVHNLHVSRSEAGKVLSGV